MCACVCSDAATDTAVVSAFVATTPAAAHVASSSSTTTVAIVVADDFVTDVAAAATDAPIVYVCVRVRAEAPWDQLNSETWQFY